MNIRPGSNFGSFSPIVSVNESIGSLDFDDTAEVVLVLLGGGTNVPAPLVLPDRVPLDRPFVCAQGLATGIYLAVCRRCTRDAHHEHRESKSPG
jgi:hypothetical protein